MADFATARHNMVESQIRTNKVTDRRVIAAMSEIPREQFVGKRLEGVAYIDDDLPIGGGRHMMEPMVLARLLQALEIGSDDVALDIGCATGYSSAALGRLASTVVALESDSDLARNATSNLAALGVDNVVVVEGALTEGYPRQAPYDAILLGGAVAAVPPAITALLSEGGRLGAVICDGAGGMGKATLFIRRGDGLAHRVLFDAAIPALPGFGAEVGFEF